MRLTYSGSPRGSFLRDSTPLPPPLDAGEGAGGLRDGKTFRLNRTQGELAPELATTRESVARALGEIRRKGIIKSQGREVTVLPVRGLVDLARGEGWAIPRKPAPTAM